MTECEQNLFIAVAKKIKNDNISLQALSDKVMAEVRAYCDKHKKEYKALTDFEKERLTNVRYVLGEISKIKYTKEQLDRAIENNLKRIPGNLADEDKRWELYNVLANLNFKCIYSDTLLVGGKQSIHLDHIIPVKLGGPTDDWNILPICGSCNDSKWKNHLLDWWEKEHTPQDEHKLVYIFEYMANRLLKSLNTKGVKVVTTLTDDEIRKAIELENKERQQEESKQQTIDLEDDYEDIEDVEEVKDEKIKRLDAITFLYQMLNHIKQNRQYIISPDNLNQGVLDIITDKDKQRLIDKKFKKVEKLFNSIYKQNKRLTGVKTDIQLLDEQRKMVEYIKSLDIVSYYHISYTYFDELQQMLDQGKTDKEIQEFCNSVDRAFNVDIFIQQLQDFMATHDGMYPTQSKNAEENERELAIQIQRIRQARKGHNKTKLSQSDIDKLDKINFAWTHNDESEYPLWFIMFCEELPKFIKRNNGRYPNNYNPKDNLELKLAGQVDGLRQAYKKIQQGKKSNTRLTGKMIDKLKEIDFKWEATHEDKYGNWFETLIEELPKFIKEHNGKYPSGRSKDDSEKRLAQYIENVRDAMRYKYKPRKTQREGAHYTRLTGDMINRLDQIDFIWEVDKDWFTPFCKELPKFIKNNGGRYPKQEAEDKIEQKLGMHVHTLRKAYTKIQNGKKSNTKLTGEMIEELKKIDFAWSAKDEPETLSPEFIEFCNELKIFVKEKREYPKNSAIEEIEKRLAEYIQNIRNAYKKIQNGEKARRKLNQTMINKLNEMHFAWTAKEQKEKIALFLTEQGIEQGLSA